MWDGIGESERGIGIGELGLVEEGFEGFGRGRGEGEKEREEGVSSVLRCTRLVDLRLSGL